MKQFLVIGINYYPELTGIGKYTSEFCNYLAEKNYKVDVITGVPYYPQWKVQGNYSNWVFKKEKIKGVNVYRTPLYIPSNPSGMKRMLQDGLFFTASLLFINYLLLFKRKRYDYIFVAVPSFLLGLLGLYYRFFSRKSKVIYHIQDLQIDAAAELGMIKNKVLLKALYGIENFILKKADYISTISVGMQGKILNKPAQLRTCYLFPNWINNEVVYPVSPKPSWDESTLVNKKVVFYSGAIGEKQGLEIILNAAEYFEKNNGELAFVIAGEGPYKEKLMEYAKQRNLSNIHFRGLVPNNLFNVLLNAAYIHLVIQKREAGDLVLPSKLTNILAVGGCAIITADDNTTLYTLAQEHGFGYIIPPIDGIDSSKLQNAIKSLLANEKNYRQIKNNALKYAHDYLYQRHITKTFLELIEK